MQKLIFVSLTVQGTHCWKECDIEEVIWLKYPHRHLFHITVYVDVSKGNGNRDVEFFVFKNYVLRIMKENFTYDQHTNTFDFEGMSCEHIALRLIDLLSPVFGVTKVIVSEDGENGAEVIV